MSDLRATQPPPAQRRVPEIPYVDIAAQHAPLKDELLDAVASVIDSGQFILGPQVEAFERSFAELIGVRHAVGLNSGTDALLLALRALGIGPGDEVITAPNSFVATAAAIELTGARTVFADVDETYNLDPRAVAAAVTNWTKAILPVHLTGRACDFDPLAEIARRHGIPIVEDAAQAVAAEYKGRRVGALGDVGCFSLHPLKTLGGLGDGGVVTTDDDSVAARIRSLRNIGLKNRDDAVAWAGNSRLDTLQAALLLVKLERLEEWTERRRAAAELYASELAGIPAVKLPPPDRDGRSVFHTFVVRVERREELRAFLTERGIGTAVHYPMPIHLTTIGRRLGYSEGSFPNAERQAREILSLPVHHGLTDNEIATVALEIRHFYEDRPT